MIKAGLSMNKADAQNYLYPLLNEDEKIAEGIKVITYDPNGKEFEIVSRLGCPRFMSLLEGGKHSFMTKILLLCGCLEDLIRENFNIEKTIILLLEK
jgi:hypothetical protein